MTSRRPDIRRVFVDTSAFFAFADARDANHAAAIARRETLTRAGSRLFTTNFVVAETHALVIARRNRNLALATLRWIDLSDISQVRAEVEDEAAARGLIERYQDKTFSLVDAISFAVMDRLEIPTAFSFDSDFAQYGFATL